MSRCPTINFQLSIMSIWIAKHISTNVSFKITIRKRHVYIDIHWPWIWNQHFCLGIWSDDRTKMIVLLSFQLTTRLNSRNTYETVFHNESDTLICIWILIFPISIIEVTSPRDWSFWLYISSSHDSWPPSTWNSLEHKTWGEMERCVKRAYQLLKMWKKKISWNI